MNGHTSLTLASLTLLVSAWGHAAAPPPVRLDQHGDPLPAGAITRLGSQRFRNLQAVWDVAVSPDGRLLAVSTAIHSGDREARHWRAHPSIGLWDTATGRQLRTIRPDDFSHSFAFSPDGKLLAVRGNGPIGMWDVATGTKVRRLLMEDGYPGPVAFTPDGKSVAALRNDVVHLLDAATGKEMRRIGRGVTPGLVPPEHRDHPIRALAFSPDGRSLATGTDDGRIGLWDVRTGKLIRRFGPPAWGACAAFSPDGKTLAVWGQEPITLAGLLHEMGRWKRPWDLTSLADVWMGVRLLAGDTPLALYAASSGKRRQLPGQALHHQAAFSPDGRSLASWGSDGVLRVWDMGSGKVTRSIPLRRIARPPTSRVEDVSVAFLPDGKTIASWGQWGHEDVVRLHDASDGHELFPLEGHGQLVSAVAFTPDSRAVVTAGEWAEGCLVWEARTGRRLARLRPQPVSTTTLGFSAAGTLLGGERTDGGEARWWTVGPRTRPRLAQVREVYRGSRGGLAPDGNLFTPLSGAGPHPFQREDTWTFRLRFLGETNHVVGCAETREARFSVTRGGNHDERSSDRPCYSPLPALSGDGRLFAAAGWWENWRDDYIIRLWEVTAGKGCRQLTRLRELVSPDSDFVTALTLSPDGRMLASAHAFRTIRVWEVASGRERCRFQAGADGVGCLAFSPDGVLLASGGYRTHTGLVWDLVAHASGEAEGWDVKDWWTALADENPAAAFAAVTALIRAEGRAVEFLKGRLPLGRGRLRRLLADLDADTFPVRDAASRELAVLAELAEPQLRGEVAVTGSAEVRRRIGRLLRRLGHPVPAPEALRRLRAVEVLERIGSAAAVRLLRRLAEEEPAGRLGQEAKASLERLRSRARPSEVDG